MNKIAAIDKFDVHRITSGQVIIDLSTAAKELVDNSIDAEAHSIEVTFKNYGLDSLECSDDGVGIDPENYDFLALKHYTSKISSFQDVSSVQTLGFRGEALSSLCAISHVIVTTTTKPPRADKLEYDINGHLTSKTTTSRNKGTNFQVSQLFYNLPVRRKEFTKTCKRQFAKCISLLQAYAIIQDGIKFSVWHITASGKKQLMLSTLKNNSIQKNILNIFGSSGFYGLAEMKLDLDLNPYKPQIFKKYMESGTFNELDYRIEVSGYISKNSFGCGHNSKDRQLIYINKRPIEYPLIVKCCNEVYRTFNNVQYPVFFLNINLLSEFIDVNVTPDKRTILLHNERYVIDILRDELTKYFDNQELLLPKQITPKSEYLAIKKQKIDNCDHSDEDIKVGNETHEKDFSDETSMGRSSKEDENEKINEKQDYTEEDKAHEKDTTTTSNDDKNSVKDREEYCTTNITDDINSSEIEVPYIANTQLSNEELVDENEMASENDSEINLHGYNLKGINKHSDEVALEHNPNVLQQLKTSRNSKVKLKSFINPSFDDLEFKKNSNTDTRIVSEQVYLEIDGETEEYTVKLTADEKLLFITDHDTSENREENCCENHSDSNDTDLDDALDVQLESQEINIRTPISFSSNSKIARSTYRSLGNRTPATSPKSAVLATSLSINNLRDLVNESVRIKANHSGEQKVMQGRSIKKNHKIEDREEGEQYLTLTFNKEEFNKMDIVGQFNLGFIIVTLKVNGKYDLFIIDQHASDEKYNFETLQKTTIFKSQRLIAPQPVELSVIDELLVMENIAIFEQNGFKIEINESEENGAKIKLISLPVSKRTLFDINDFNELVHLVKTNVGINKNTIKCSKIRSMFAMRACRSSIMIGKPLTKKTMHKIVKHLSELHKPWNCPHGRPTMRHLMELKNWDSFSYDYDI